MLWMALAQFPPGAFTFQTFLSSWLISLWQQLSSEIVLYLPTIMLGNLFYMTYCIRITLTIKMTHEKGNVFKSFPQSLLSWPNGNGWSGLAALNSMYKAWQLLPLADNQNTISNAIHYQSKFKQNSTIKGEWISTGRCFESSILPQLRRQNHYMCILIFISDTNGSFLWHFIFFPIQCDVKFYDRD